MIKFDLLVPPYLGPDVAEPVYKYLRKRFGSSGLKIDSAFSSKVNWKPTIQIKSSATELVLVEVAEAPYPVIFRVAYPGLIHDEATKAIRVYQACPLSAYQEQKYNKAIRELKAHGFGLVTVDEQGLVDEKFAAAILIHHISDVKFEEAVKNLPGDVKSAFRAAFDVYRTNPRQGLQLAGQIVEGLIHLIAAGCKKLGWLSAYSESSAAAKVIDDLYESNDNHLKHQRASFGGARQFMKLDRNASSHPAKSKQQAQANVMTTKDGFELALRVSGELSTARKALGITKKLTL